MPKVTIDHQSELSASDAFSKLQSVFEKDQNIRRFDPSINYEFSESKMTGTAKGKQFKADFSVAPSSKGSTVTIVVDLPLLLTPFKGKIQETIQKTLGQYLA